MAAKTTSTRYAAATVDPATSRSTQEDGDEAEKRSVRESVRGRRSQDMARRPRMDGCGDRLPRARDDLRPSPKRPHRRIGDAVILAWNRRAQALRESRRARFAVQGSPGRPGDGRMTEADGFADGSVAAWALGVSRVGGPGGVLDARYRVVVGASFASVATMTVDPDERPRGTPPQGAKTAAVARTKAPRRRRRPRRSPAAAFSAARWRAQVRQPQGVDVAAGSPGPSARRCPCLPPTRCSTERMSPAGSLNQAIGGPVPVWAAGRSLLVVRDARSARSARRPPRAVDGVVDVVDGRLSTVNVAGSVRSSGR